MLDLEVIDDPVRAALALDPTKQKLLAELAQPQSAASLATRVGLTRQKTNYHLRALEDHELVEAVEERQWGGLTERVVVASAASYVVSPTALGPIASDPARSGDRSSASYLIALAARIVREVGELLIGARQSNKRLATLSVDTVIRFKSPAERAAFTNDLATMVTTLVARYHDERSQRGRPHRLVIGSYPTRDTTRTAEKACP
jgi:DNA-binding transcriptional ArsR family regulator